MASYVERKFGESELITASTKTLDVGDSGVVQVATVDCTITLPSTVVGRVYTIVNGGSGATEGSVTVTISPAAADKIMGNGFTAADDKDMINTDGRGYLDYVTLVGDGVDGWHVAEVNGTWTRQA